MIKYHLQSALNPCQHYINVEHYRHLYQGKALSWGAEDGEEKCYCERLTRTIICYSLQSVIC